MVDNAMFRCEQQVCAYADLAGTPARVVLQPCDMDPDGLARCSCYASYGVEWPAGAESVEVYVRGDASSGLDEPALVGSVELGAPEVVLCDGSSALRFAATNAGGNLSGAPSIADELGWSFLLIDGQCRYWSMVAPEQPVRSGLLSELDAADFSAELRLGRWAELPPPPAGGCPDGTTTNLRYRDEQALPISCATTELTEGYSAWLATLHERGQDLAEEVRYTLAVSQGSYADMSLSWPLALDPAEVAVPADDAAVPLVLAGEEAAALRALRAQYVESVPGLGPWLRIPVVYDSGSASPSYYELALRDVTPFEVDGRLDLEAFFE